MKLEQLTIDGAPNRHPIQLSGFSNGLTFVYGENSSGKTSLGQFLRSTLFANTHNTVPAATSELLAGRSRISSMGQQFDLHRLPNQTTVQPIGSDSRSHSIATSTFTQNISLDVYDTVFNFSFKNTPRNANRLATVLTQQLGVSPGANGNDDSAVQAWHREQESCRLQLASVDTNIAALNREKAEILQQQSNQAQRQNQLTALEAQIADLQRQIGELNSNSALDQLSQIDAEIQTLRLRIDNARTEVIYPVADKGVDHSPLYARLDELENQIRRWRHVQTDVQNQRVRLRDEMLVWNELTLDSNEHPYHTAREILVSLESKVDQTERSANHWADVGNTRVDTEQLADTLGQLCQTMRDDLYSLCNELAHQYKHLRHKAAATELKQLRRCYTEMGENIDRLVQRRASVVKEIQQFDPAGAEAIARSEAQFCLCAQHEGYLEARKRYVGPMTASAPEPVRIEPDLSHERSRLSVLESERTALLAQVSHVDTDLAQLNRRLADLMRERDLLLGQNTSFDTNRLASIALELANQEEHRLRLLAKSNLPKPQIIANPILTMAANWLPKLTNGEISKAYVSTPSATGECHLAAQNATGQTLPFESLQPSTQDQIYLSLILAAKDHLAASQAVEIPTVIDDTFSRISGDRITPTFELLTEVSQRGHQIILLSQHRYIADRAPGITILQIDGEQPVLQPGPNYPQTPPAVAPVATQSAELRQQISQSQLTQNTAAPYPLSKYRRNDEVLLAPSPRIYSAPNEPSELTHPRAATPRTDYDRHNSEKSARYSAMQVDRFARPLPVEGSFGEATAIASTGLFDSADIRFFENYGLYTIGDLLSISDETVQQSGIDEAQLEQWQASAYMMMCVPTLQAAEVRTLSACGIVSPQQMASLHARDLLDRVQRLLDSNHDHQHQFTRSVNFERVLQWMEGLDRTRSRWQGRSDRERNRSSSSYSARSERQSSQSSFSQERRNYERDDNDRSRQGRSARSRRMDDRPERDFERGNRERRSVSMPHSTREPRAPREPRPPREPRRERTSRPKYTQRSSQTNFEKTAPAIAPIRSTNDRESNAGRTTHSSSKSEKRSSAGKLKFYLNLDDQLEAAPSIGPKTAERFEKIGVVTVSDFLKQTAESMADKLNYKRITADTIRQWQHQARLNCRVPNLRGHDVQLLVGIEITEPEELATMQPQNLLEKVSPFAESKEGLKIIRSGKKPDLAEITDWITWAAKNRSIQAA
jgi:predicted flap endonuclease-1-like 5' DNA nuclease